MTPSWLLLKGKLYGGNTEYLMAVETSKLLDMPNAY